MRSPLNWLRKWFVGLWTLYVITRIPRDTAPVHEGATETYAEELHTLIVERDLNPTGEFDAAWLRTHCDLEDIEETAKERIEDICRLAINMLNNDIWWDHGYRSSAA